MIRVNVNRRSRPEFSFSSAFSFTIWSFGINLECPASLGIFWAATSGAFGILRASGILGFLGAFKILGFLATLTLGILTLGIFVRLWGLRGLRNWLIIVRLRLPTGTVLGRFWSGLGFRNMRLLGSYVTILIVVAGI